MCSQNPGSFLYISIASFAFFLKKRFPTLCLIASAFQFITMLQQINFLKHNSSLLYTVIKIKKAHLLFST